MRPVLEAGRASPARLRLRRLEVGAVLGTVALAAVARLVRLDLMEFKADEAEACRLALHALGYSEPGVGTFFPTAGLTSSVGVLNPPLFVYLVAIPLAIVRSPIAAALAIALANVLAVWLCYVVGKRCFSRFVGVVSAALFALSPWAVVFSRKIWAQDLLPLSSALFLLQLHSFVVLRRARSACWLIVLAAAATQLHFSAWALVPILIAALVLGRDRIEWTWVALGVGGALALYAPFLAYHAGAAWHSALHGSPYTGPGLLGRIGAAAHLTVAIAGGDGLAGLVGSQTPLALPLSLVVGLGGIAGVLLAATRVAGRDQRAFRRLLVAWYVLPFVLLSALRVNDYIHYYLVLLPLPFLGFARLLEVVNRRSVVVSSAVALAALACFALLDVRTFRIVVRDGGAPGSYGVAYRFKRAVVDRLVREHPSRDFDVGADAVFGPGTPGSEFRFLLWNQDPSAPGPATPPTVGYVIIGRTAGLPPYLAAAPGEASFPRATRGPLQIVTVPVSG